VGHYLFIAVHLIDEIEMLLLQLLCTKSFGIKAAQVFHFCSDNQAQI